MSGVCLGCGCTDDDPCLDAAGMPCAWVTADLCSACAETEDHELAPPLPEDGMGGFRFDPETGLWLP